MIFDADEQKYDQQYANVQNSFVFNVLKEGQIVCGWAFLKKNLIDLWVVFKFFKINLKSYKACL